MSARNARIHNTEHTRKTDPSIRACYRIANRIFVFFRLFCASRCRSRVSLARYTLALSRIH